MTNVEASTPASDWLPVADGLFELESSTLFLIGSRCTSCRTYTFPRQHGCPRCSVEPMESVRLARRGTIWTWTSQEFRPPPPYAGPEEFEPYFVGYVELPGELLVETYLVGFDGRQPRIGEHVELTLAPFSRGSDGIEIKTFAFKPEAT